MPGTRPIPGNIIRQNLPEQVFAPEEDFRSQVQWNQSVAAGARSVTQQMGLGPDPTVKQRYNQAVQQVLADRAGGQLWREMQVLDRNMTVAWRRGDMVGAERAVAAYTERGAAIQSRAFEAMGAEYRFAATPEFRQA